jgi:hypothetical protein
MRPSGWAGGVTVCSDCPHLGHTSVDDVVVDGVVVTLSVSAPVGPSNVVLFTVTLNENLLLTDSTYPG